MLVETLLDSEIRNNLLIHMDMNFRSFSEYALNYLQDQLDFDSAIPRFESWRPSQPVGSLWAASAFREKP